MPTSTGGEKPTSVRVLLGLLTAETALAALAVVYCLVAFLWGRSQAAAGRDWADLGAAIALLGAGVFAVLLLGAVVMLTLARRRRPSTPWVVLALHAGLLLIGWRMTGAWGLIATVWAVVPLPGIAVALAPDTHAWFRRPVEAH